MSSISILMATYNGELFLQEQLESLLDQTYTDWTCYIHDDGSTDNTIQILDHYSLKYPDKFMLLTYPSCGGAKENFLSLLKYANSEYVMFSDQDDVWIETKIENTLECMKNIEEKHTNIPVAVFTDLYVTDKKLNIISQSFLKYSKHDPHKVGCKDIFISNPAPGCTMMVNKSLCQMAAAFKSDRNIEMHDWWCMAIGSIFGKIGFINEPTIMYRQHGSNTLGAVSKGSIYYNIDVLKSVLKGERIAETRRRIIMKRLLAKEVYNCFYEKENLNLEFVRQMAHIDEKRKIKRIVFYINNHLYNSLHHGLWILLSC